MRFQSVRVNDIDMHFELVDHTPPWNTEPPETVLLFHGYARNMLFWQPWVSLLAGRFRVLRLDARGCGETSKTSTPDRYTIAQFADDALCLMDVLGIERVHWVGESSGGIVGLQAALTAPDRLLTLSLCDTPFKRPTEIAAVYTLGENDRASAFEKYGVGGWCRRTLSYRLDMNRASPELCEWYIAQMDKTPTDIAVALELMVRQGDMWPHLRNIKTPTLIMAGEKSLVAKESSMNDMRQALPCAKLVTLPDYGHGISLLAPDLCVAEMKTFIDAH